MTTVIETGSKQYLVSVGEKIQVEKLDLAVGDKVTFDKVVFKGDENGVQVGKPYIASAVVEGTVTKAGKGRKIHVLKYKNKSKYRRKIGHRQHFTEVEITKI